MKFIVRNHRDRKKITLTKAASESVDVSITLALSGKRVLELSDRVCEQYADSLAKYIEAKALIPIEE